MGFNSGFKGLKVKLGIVALKTCIVKYNTEAFRVAVLYANHAQF